MVRAVHQKNNGKLLFLSFVKPDSVKLRGKRFEWFFKYAAVRHTWTKVQGAQETNEASIYVMRPRLER